MRGEDTEWGRLGDVTEAGKPVLRVLEVILQILGGSEVIFAGIMAHLHRPSLVGLMAANGSPSLDYSVIK